MRLGSFRTEGQHAFGIVRENGVINLSSRVRAPSLKVLLGEGLASARGFENEPIDYPIDRVEWLPPISEPTHIIGIGLNTRSHFEETAEMMKRVPGDYPKYPRLFMRGSPSLVGHNGTLSVPDVSEQLDYEGEIALVVGRRCHNVSEDDAMQYIAGVTAANDGSVRDYQFHSSQVTAGKNFPASGGIGPWMVTMDAIDPTGLTLTTRVNGEVRQNLSMDDMLFSFPQLISYVSRIFQLEPGDIILTGSPAGIGGLRGRWLKDGDEVEVEIPGLGALKNRVIKAA